tara:strand:+ start:444 stop:1331 length:888 start_codon:yes stop_codon:yes gene_type:complete
MKHFSLALLAFATTFASAEPKPLNKYQSYSSDLMLRSDRFQYMSNGAAARCEIKDCLCRVKPPSFPAKDIFKKRRFSVYFQEGGYTSTNDSLEKLKLFLEEYKKTSSITVTSYTDECGGHDYNVDLAHKRSASVQKVISTAGFRAPTKTTFKAEAGFGHDPASRRVDVIVHTQSRLTTIVDKVQADVYLIDASGSMWDGWKRWNEIVAVSYKPGSRVYLSKTGNCRNGTSMNLVSPAGGTEIWYSYWMVLDSMKRGETLAVISDFNSDIPLTRREAAMIEAKVRSKQIKVIAVSP